VRIAIEKHPNGTAEAIKQGYSIIVGIIGIVNAKAHKMNEEPEVYSKGNISTPKADVRNIFVALQCYNDHLNWYTYCCKGRTWLYNDQ